MKIIFFDIDSNKVKKYKEILDTGNKKRRDTLTEIFGESSDKTKLKLLFYCGNLFDLLERTKIDIIVSPANSYGDMTGGIDTDICKIDSSIQEKVKNEILKSKHTDLDKKPYIPVGKCKLVQINKQYSVMIAPTMTRPKDISNTNNVFLTFNAILLYLINKYKSDDLVIACPCLGTGCGNMSAEMSAKQILQALQIHKLG
jgi:O-acetyl-ADP-ribose deacetylase (regulator of RNase III)